MENSFSIKTSHIPAYEATFRGMKKVARYKHSLTRWIATQAMIAIYNEAVKAKIIPNSAYDDFAKTRPEFVKRIKGSDVTEAESWLRSYLGLLTSETK